LEELVVGNLAQDEHRHIQDEVVQA
jgi:hypothetical protein